MREDRNRWQRLTRLSVGVLAISGCAARHTPPQTTLVSSPAISVVSIPVETSPSPGRHTDQDRTVVVEIEAKSPQGHELDINDDASTGVQLVAHADESLLGPTLADQIEPLPATEAASSLQPGSVRDKTLESAERSALACNPGLNAAAASVQKATGIWQQVGLKPNPIVGYQANEVGAEGSAGQQGLFWQQTFVRGDKLRLNREVEAWEIEKLKWEAETLRTRVITDVRVQFYATLAAQTKLQLAEELLASAEQTAEVSQQLFEASEVAEADVLQANVQAAEIAILVDNASADVTAEWRKLAILTGWNAGEPMFLAGTLDSLSLSVDFDATYQELLANSPEVRVAETRVRAARKQIERQQVQVTPNLEVQAGVAYDDAGNDTIANLQFGVPLPIHNDNRGNVSAAWANYQRACGELQRLRLALRDRLANQYRDYERASRQVQRYQDAILPAAERSLELSVKGYEAGEYSVIRTVQARQTYSQAKLASVTAAAGVRIAEARMKGLLLDNSWEADLPNAGGDNLQGIGLRGTSLSGQ